MALRVTMNKTAIYKDEFVGELKLLRKYYNNAIKAVTVLEDSLSSLRVYDESAHEDGFVTAMREADDAMGKLFNIEHLIQDLEAVYPAQDVEV